MTLKEKYGLLVERDDIINKSLPKKQLKQILTKLSIDMYTINKEVDSRRNRIEVLVQYFTNRPGMIEEESSTPVEQAFTMMLFSDFAEVTQVIVEITGCEVDDIMIKAKFNGDGIEIQTGTHKKLDEDIVPIVQKMMKHMLPPVIHNIVEEHNSYVDGENKVDIDEETEKALKKMDWDKTVKGEA